MGLCEAQDKQLAVSHSLNSDSPTQPAALPAVREKSLFVRLKVTPMTTRSAP